MVVGLGDLLSLGFAGSELVSSITSEARMDERWGFGEIKKELSWLQHHTGRRIHPQILVVWSVE